MKKQNTKLGGNLQRNFESLRISDCSEIYYLSKWFSFEFRNLTQTNSEDNKISNPLNLQNLHCTYAYSPECTCLWDFFTQDWVQPVSANDPISSLSDPKLSC